MSASSNPASGRPVLVPAGTFAGQPPIPLSQLCILVGSHPSCDLRFADEVGAPFHALIVTSDAGVYVHDLSARQDVRINGVPLIESFLTEGDHLQIGGLTCQFSAGGQAFRSPNMPPALTIEIAGKGAGAIQGRTATIGAVAQCDVRLSDVAGGDFFAILFSAGEDWFVRDLSAGTLVNGKAVTVADIHDGDVLCIAGARLRIIAPQAGQEAFVGVSAGDLQLGGMPVTLPEIAGPPVGFGRVNLAFDAKAAPTPPPLPAAKRVEPPTEPAVVSVVLPPPQVQPQPAETPKPAVKAPPRVKLPPRKAEEAVAIEGEQEPELSTIVDVFSMSGYEIPAAGTITVEETATDSADASQEFRVEIDDFAESKFWDESDGEAADAKLPARDRDYAPEIPAAEEPAPGNGDGHSAEKPLRVSFRSTATAAPPALPRSSATAADAPRRRRRRKRSPAVRVIVACVCAAAAGAAVWATIPVHSTIEGHLAFHNTPATNDPAAQPAYQSFQSNQRSRLADASLADAAVASLQHEHPDTAAKWLAAGSAPLAQLIAQAHFVATGPRSADLVMSMASADPRGDTERLAAVMRGMYKADDDLVSAEASARKALADFQPNIDSRRHDMADLAGKMADQQKIIDAGHAVATQVPGLLAAVKEAGQKCAAAQLAVLSQQAKVELLTAQQTPAAASASQPAGGGDGDVRLEQLLTQESILNDRINSLAVDLARDPLPQKDQIRKAYQERMDRELAVAARLYTDHPELAQALAASGEMQTRVRQLIKDMESDRAQLAAEVESLQTLLEQVSRLHDEVADGADRIHPSRSHHPRLREESHLASGLGKLIEAGKSRLADEQKLIGVTLQTLVARLNAVGVPNDLSTNQHVALDELYNTISATNQVQYDYAGELAKATSTARQVDALKEQLADITRQADERKTIVAVASSASKDKSRLAADLAQADADLEKQTAAAQAAETDFISQALGGSDAALKVYAAHQADQTLNMLREANDAKQSDVNTLEDNLKALQQTIDSTLSVNLPTEDDVRVTTDNSRRRSLASAGAAGIVLAFFAAVNLLSGSRRKAE